MMRKAIKNLLALLLAASMCLALPCAAFADETAVVTETVTSAGDAGTVNMTIFSDEELTKLVADFVEANASKGVKADKISIAYTYTATGETWFYNPDEWYYSASLYKVPLMMILAQKEYEGELTQESNIKGLTLAEAENSILVYSNNDYAHLMLNYLGTDQEAREMYKQFSSQPDEYYDPDFIDYSYFSVRFMNDVMTTLFTNPERFPHIIDCLKLAQPTGYFHINLDPSIEIAQKYGSFKEFNNTSGIIYTENPIILTVMTENVARPEEVLAEAAKVFTDYTYTLDAKLAAYKVEKAQAEESARREAEEAERIKAEQDAELAEQIEAQRQAEELARQEAEKAEQERIAKEERRAKTEALLKKVGVIVIIAAAIGLSITVIVKRAKGSPARDDGRRSAPQRRERDMERYSEMPRRTRPPQPNGYPPQRREREMERYSEVPRRTRPPQPQSNAAQRRVREAERYDEIERRGTYMDERRSAPTDRRRSSTDSKRSGGGGYIPKH